MAERTKTHGVVDEHRRWCDGCDQWHGTLFPCRHYSDAVLCEIADGQVRYRELVTDPDWIANTDPVVVAIHQLFAGSR